MTIEEAIKKAMKGGYEPKAVRQYYRFPPEVIGWDRREEDRSYVLNPILDDPLFWQSLGKALGWVLDERIDGCTNRKCPNCEDAYQEYAPAWIYHWLEFTKHLAAGHSVESFFQSL